MKRLTNSKPSAKRLRHEMSKERHGRDLRIKRLGHCEKCRKLLFLVMDFGQSADVEISDPGGYACDQCGHVMSAEQVRGRFVPGFSEGD